MWKQQEDNAAQQKVYSNAVTSAAENNELLGTWTDEKRVVRSKIETGIPDRYALSLFADGRFSLTWDYHDGLYGHDIREFHGIWRKIAPGVVRLTYENSTAPDTSLSPEDIDLNTITNTFVTNDRILKE
ncbi:MAG: hypothetical protein ACYC26_01035 [Phycisphaerales bacterium]